MKNLLIAVLISIASLAHPWPRNCGASPMAGRGAGMDKSGNPIVDTFDLSALQNPQDTEYTKEAFNINLRSLIMTLMYINNAYYKDVDLAECVTQIMKAGVSECTDRYSFYLEPDEVREENQSFLKGEMVGIGAGLELNEGGGIKILNVFEESPAEKAGLLENDVIASISEGSSDEPVSWTSLKKMPLGKVVNLIRGKAGTVVKLLIIRGNEQKVLVITRGIMKIPFLRSKMLKEKVGYVQISQFGGEVSKQFYQAMQKLDLDGAQVVILDLRNNPGGKMDAALEMSSLFAKTNESYATILYVKDRSNPAMDLTINNSQVGILKSKKLIVLQNGGSASASEIFSGYLKYETDAIVIGEKSYGKGIVQSVLPLDNGGALHLTVSEYFIGRKAIKVHGVGISPTIEMKQTKRHKNEAEDELLQKALQEAEKLLK